MLMPLVATEPSNRTMGQLSQFLRRGTNFISHWCPACLRAHSFTIADAPKDQIWDWDGKIYEPTFTPSMVVTTRPLDKRCRDRICHYTITKGEIEFHVDCTHHLKGVKMALPALPDWLRDDPCLRL